MQRMNSLTRFKRFSNLLQSRNHQIVSVKFASKSSSSSSSDSSDEQSTRKSKQEEAKKKLDLLLKDIIIKSSEAKENVPKLDLARPKSRRFKNTQEPGVESTKIETVERKLVKATKEVAKTIGGDVKKTEAELLSKLLNPLNAESDSKDLNSLIKSMNVEKDNAQPEELSRAHQMRQIMQTVKGKTMNIDSTNQRPLRRTTSLKRLDLSKERVSLFGNEPLGIFTKKVEEMENFDDLNETWNKLHAKELKLTITHPPANYFQEMILWTEQGKLWKFPIDNEQGLDEEKKIYFTEHIFLEKHLEPWCPPKGPIRHFMELVCVGLSKNSYITVQDKKDHINWFKEYFAEKQQLLKEVAAIPQNFEFVDKNENKQIAD